jgi:catechol 2,3-dioxygenase
VLPDTTHIGCVTLRVASLDKSLAFYESLLGLKSVGRNSATVALRSGAEGDALIALVEQPGVRRQPVRAAGLYHTAFLLPTRRDLGFALQRLVDQRYPMQGASDHAVSEALYLADPDGNGVEIYADRRREEWPRVNGELAMTSLPLNLESLIAEAAQSDDSEWDGFPAGSTVGHIHLRVPSVERFRNFLTGIIGFDLISARYPGAVFVSAGGYHHHVAANVWEGTNVPPLPPDAAGLIEFEVVVPEVDAIGQIHARAAAAGVRTEHSDGAVLESDGIRVRLVPEQRR